MLKINHENNFMECRICFEDNDPENMIAPCNCNGTSKWVHRKCIEKWIRESEFEEASKKCMECKQDYQYRYYSITQLLKIFQKVKLFFDDFAVFYSIISIIVILYLELNNPEPDFELYKKIIKGNFWFWFAVNILTEILCFYLSICEEIYAILLKIH